jgi:uncharacterized membrane protein (UPF0127 family)
MKVRYFLFSLVFLLGVSQVVADTSHPPIKFDTIGVEMGGQEYKLEHAKTMEQRARGLMYRKSICLNCGMLFVFDQKQIGSIWMKNTFIPLDLAYVDETGTIVDIFQLKPHDLSSVRSSKPVVYAIEMNVDWFAKKRIKVGDRIVINFPDKQHSAANNKSQY